MSETVISVRNLYKEYKLGVIGHGTLHKDLQSWWARVSGKEDPNSLISSHHNKETEERSFLALKEISFKVNKGEILGIIGKNGAGKSTLLKIISRITTPTKGEIKIKGRVGSLLEVGTGFHPELTGRENIFLNGAILGMNKKEIKSKIDGIIDFAGIERHIDTPVKRYSSGMYVRLAFSVAAHLDPEILIVDEVLAVGDADFQKKCVGKMKDISEGQGRTVLFVSHNMAAIRKLCSRTILLEKGSLKKNGNTNEIVNEYLRSGLLSGNGVIRWNNDEDSPGNDIVKLKEIKITQGRGKITDRVDISEDVKIHLVYNLLKDKENIFTAIRLKSQNGNIVFSSGDMPGATSSNSSWYGKKRMKGIYQTICTIPGDFLNDTSYYISIHINKDVKKEYIYLEDCLNFRVIDTGRMRKVFTGGWIGEVRPLLKWETGKISKK